MHNETHFGIIMTDDRNNEDEFREIKREECRRTRLMWFSWHWKRFLS